MPDSDWLKELKETHKAVRSYARIEYEALVRKVIYRLQRINASGIFDSDYRYKTLWDEYCHEVQEGPTNQIEHAWENTITPFLDDVTERIPNHTAVLLSIFASWELGEDDDPEFIKFVNPDLIRTILENQLKKQAIDRKLLKFKL